jgi:hypothetical protein
VADHPVLLQDRAGVRADMRSSAVGGVGKPIHESVAERAQQVRRAQLRNARMPSAAIGTVARRSKRRDSYQLRVIDARYGRVLRIGPVDVRRIERKVSASALSDY